MLSNFFCGYCPEFWLFYEPIMKKATALLQLLYLMSGKNGSLQSVEFALTGTGTLVAAAIGVKFVSHCYFQFTGIPFCELRNVQPVVIKQDVVFVVV